MAKIRRNRAKAKLAAGKVVTALGNLDDPEWIDHVGHKGFDAIWIEAEHGPTDYDDVGNLTRACDLWNMSSIVRVGWAQPNLIYRMLDRGAQGIVVPHVNSRAEAELVVDSVKYAPIGHRGMFHSRQGYGVDDYRARANDETMIVVLIESIDAIHNLDDILEVNHIDAFVVAQHDLAQSMGHVDHHHPEVVQTTYDAIARIIAAGHVAGTPVHEHDVCKWIEAGVRFCYHSAHEWILDGADRYLSAVNAAQVPD